MENYPILSRALLNVQEKYGDPSCIDPKRMILGSLDAVAAALDEVIVRWEPASSQLTVTAGESTEILDLTQASSVTDVATYLTRAMQTVERGAEIRDRAAVEYAAVNGMLSALDPLSKFIEPRVFEEMRTQSLGELGGLGFVMAMRDGNLTIIRVLGKGPAKRAGIEAGDILAEIGDHSTANADLEEAVEWLRGKPGSEVAIAWSRGSGPLQRATLVREVIALEPVTATLLEDGIAYANLSQFTSAASRDLKAALDSLRTRAGGPLRGIILDLRGNQGGLLEQAVAVADLFLSDGVVVAVEGDAKRLRIREVKHAFASDGDVTDVPMIVLTDGESAAAAEIVAGALKENGRAVVLGTRTAGAGSIQLLFPGAGDGTSGGALKLTIARFFTPGGTPIAGSGIAPDVALRAACIRAGEVRAFAPPRELQAPLARAGALDPGDREPGPAVQYLLEDAGAKPDCEEPRSAASGRAAEDYAVRFSRDLLQRAPTADRTRLLAIARTFAGERRADEEARIAAKLASLGIDWSSGPAGGVPRAEVSVSTSPTARAAAGETVQFTVTVENRGNGDLRRLRGWSVADGNPLLDRREFVFGTVRAGERRSQTVSVRIPGSMPSRRDAIVFRFEAENGRAPHDIRTTFEVIERAKPRFAVRARIEAAPSPSKSAVASQRDHRILRVDARNVGGGASAAGTYAFLKSLDGGIFIMRGRELFGAVTPGDTKTATFPFRIRDGVDGANVRVRVAVSDASLDETTSYDLELPVAALRGESSGVAWKPTDREWHEPARIALVPARAGAPVVDAERFTLRGTALAAPGCANVRDIRILANGRKVLYRRAPENAGAPEIELSSEIPLAPGENTITVEARTVEGLHSRRTLHVYRRSSDEVSMSFLPRAPGEAAW